MDAYAFSFFGKPQESNICPNIKIIGKLKPAFTDNEKELICGDKKTDDAVGDSWKHVPRSQSEFHLKVFLQSRGYFNPILTRTGKTEGLTVDIGKPTMVSKMKGEGVPAEIDLSKKRRIVGYKLTPDLLNELASWLVGRLQANGYGCPDVETFGNPDTGEVDIIVKSGPRQKIISVKDETVAGINHSALDRYNAFHVGDYYNGDNLAITERRVKSSGILQGLNFNHTCEKDGIVVSRVGIEGAPRLVRVGVGANTEGILLLKASWQNTRLWSSASMFDVSTYLSTQQQTVAASMNLYVFGGSRDYLHPEVIVSRQIEDPYEIGDAKTSFLYGTSYDNASTGIKFTAGPVGEYVNTVSGHGPKDSFFLSFDTDLTIRDHLQEFYATNPRTGYMFNLHTSLNDPSFYSTAEAQRVDRKSVV